MSQKSKQTPPGLDFSFYRLELRVLMETAKSTDEFIAAVAKQLELRDQDIEKLELKLRDKVYLLNKLDIDHE